MPLDHTPIAIGDEIKFSGLYDRGYDEDCPVSFFPESLNTKFTGDIIETRDGYVKIFTIGTVKRIHIYKRRNEATRLIILGASGNFYDSSNLSSPILTIASATDFSLVNFYNRCYITPHTGIQGIASEYVYVYDGTTCRAAGGASPTSSPTVALGASGNVESGIHLVGIVYETTSGFITPIDATKIVAITADDVHKLLLTSIPTGPTGTSARRIIVSRAIDPLSYSGNTSGYAMFFAPNGRIADNTTTTLSINFYDADLVSSADYLFDARPTIPAGVGIGQYGNRMLVWGIDSDPNLVLVSATGEPESFQLTSGFITVDPSESDGVRNTFENRGLLYIQKPTRCHVTQDNGFEPNTWDMQPVDKGVGTECFGVATIIAGRGANVDFVVIASRQGLVLFTGIFNFPELTFNVENVWKRINFAAFKTVQVTQDTQNKLLFISVPLDGATNPNYLLVADYAKGLNNKDIRWHLWSFPNNPKSILVDIDATTAKTFLRIAGESGNIYSITPATRQDDGTAINSYIKTSLFNKLKNYVHHLAAVGLRVSGVGTLNITAYGLDDVNSATIPALTLATSPGREYLQKTNFQNEQIMVKVGCNNGSEYFILREITLYIKELWAARPS